ncbi:MAG: VOC family protein [Petrimonas sp.]|nr:VOC family protein [Petrimonas sp.]
MITKFDPYFTFNGTCEEAFNFYKKVFGGDFTHLVRYGDLPEEKSFEHISRDMRPKIRFIALPLNGETTLMGNDNVTSTPAIIGENVKVSIITDTKEEAERLFDSLSGGGTVKAPFKETFWGAYYGSLIDKFDINWMIEFREEQPQHGFEDNANIHIP